MPQEQRSPVKATQRHAFSLFRKSEKEENAPTGFWLLYTLGGVAQGDKSR
jgi:hypothetical protein